MVIKKIKLGLKHFAFECHKAVEMAKMSYITKPGNKVNKPGTFLRHSIKCGRRD